MKSGTNAVGLWIVGGLTAMIYSFYGGIPGSVDCVNRSAVFCISLFSFS